MALDRSSLWTVDETAAFLGVTPRVVRDFVRDGVLPYIAASRGLKRPRKMFDPDDVQRFVDARRRIAPCPSISRADRRSTTSTFSSTVIALPARRSAGAGERPSATKAKSPGQRRARNWTPRAEPHAGR